MGFSKYKLYEEFFGTMIMRASDKLKNIKQEIPTTGASLPKVQVKGNVQYTVLLNIKDVCYGKMQYWWFVGSPTVSFIIILRFQLGEYLEIQFNLLFNAGNSIKFHWGSTSSCFVEKASLIPVTLTILHRIIQKFFFF